MNSVIERDVTDDDILASPEILEGTIYKQRGFITDVDSGEKCEYWLERIPGSEEKVELYDFGTGIIREVDGAIFEMYFKDEDGNWRQVGGGPLPTDEEIWKQQHQMF